MKKRKWAISIISVMLLGLLAIVFYVQKSNVTPKVVKSENNISFLLNMMLKSHTTWQTLKGTLIVERLSTKGDDMATFTQSVEIVNPNKGKLVVYDHMGKKVLTWAANGTSIVEVDENSKTVEENSQQDFSKELALIRLESDKVEKETIIRHPMAMILPSPAAEYIYSTSLAQRDGTYEWVDEEEMIGRKVWILDFFKQNDQNEITMKARYWVDQVTGVILQATVFSTDPETSGALIESVSFTDIEFDKPIQESNFTLSQAGLVKKTGDPFQIIP